MQYRDDDFILLYYVSRFVRGYKNPLGKIDKQQVEEHLTAMNEAHTRQEEV